MKTKYNVFELIKTMEPGEKRHFKLFASVYDKEQGKNILRLYSVLEPMKEYDDEKIYKKLGEEKFIKHLHVYKKKLYDAIMKSLRNYHSEDNTNEWLYDYLKDVRLLLKKNLISDADHLLKKARKLAEEKENHFVLFEINKWQRNITTQTATLDQMEMFAKTLYVDQRKTLASIDQIIESSALSLRTWLLYRKYGWPAPEHVKEKYQELINDANRIINESSPLLARLYTREILGRANRAIENHDQSLIEYQSLLDVFKSNRVFMADHLSEYVTCVSNLLYLSTSLRNDELTDKLLYELRKLPDEFPYHITTQVERRIFETVYNALITKNNENKQYEKNVELIQIVDRGLKKFAGTVARVTQADFYFNCSLSLFLSQEYAQALTWVNKYINDPERESVKDIDLSLHLLTLLIHAELGNTDYIESFIRVFRRKHPEATTNVTRIRLLLHFVDEYARANAKDKINVLDKIKATFDNTTAADTDNIVFNYLILDRWMDGR